MRRFVCIGLMTFFGMLPAFAQKAIQEIPLVIAGNIPVYPLAALHARIQGMVKIRVTADGKKVTSLDVKSGPPMLVRFTKENILTWRFAEHKPTTFVTTFEYLIKEPSQCTFSNGTAIVHLPLEVSVSANGIQTCDPATEIKPHS